MRKILAYLFKQAAYKACVRKAFLYHSCRTVDEINQYRLERFNEMWKDAYMNVPFYMNFKEKNKLPDSINELSDIKSWPIVTKKDLQLNPSLLRRKEAPDGYSKTGGSTGEPLHFGTYHSRETYATSLIGRVALDIFPGDKCFLLWGHQHLYGKGLKRQFVVMKRTLQDWFLNYYRFSAYDLSVPLLKSYYDKLIKIKPDYVIGFSPSVLAFCRANQEYKSISFKMKGIICTAGPLQLFEKEEISAFFNAPVIMEYGSVECGVMAYTTGTDKEYRVFPDTHILETKLENGYYKNIVTRLTKEYVPLIRYDIGDYLVPSSEEDFPLSLKDVIGRPSDVIKFPNGTSIYFALINDVAKQVEKVLSVQTIVKSGSLNINFLMKGELLNEDIEKITNRLYTVAPGLKGIPIIIEKKDKLIQTPAGKISAVVYQ